jgi:5'-nucleotidase
VKKILYIDMDGVLVDFTSGLGRIPDEVREAYAGHPDDIPGIFALMGPMPGAIDAFQELSGRFDTYVLSTAPWDNPSAWSDKVRWVQEHLGQAAYKRLILTHHKDLNRGDFLVDDRPKHGAEKFGAGFIQFGSEKYPDWPAVLRHLRPLSEG